MFEYLSWQVFPTYDSNLFGTLLLKAVTEALMEPAKYPRCSGTRNLHDNLSDLRAQVAANQKVQVYMV